MIDLSTYGYTDPGIDTGDLIPGRITELRRERYKLICRHGEVPAVIAGSLRHSAQAREDFPTVGDFVLLEYNGSGSSRIVRLLPRRSKFSRSDFSGHAEGYVKNVVEQVVAANMDYVFILSSLNRDFKVNRILRYISAAGRCGAQPVVLLTKADLVDDLSGPLDAVRRAAPGTPVHPISSITRRGLDELGAYLQPARTVVLLGMSGVGKSSLLNVLAEQEVMEVKAVREDDSRGRHTTTHRQLYRLSGGALVIDTPGMRELGLWDSEEGIGAAFPEIEALIARCRFSDCRHETEPGCAVREARERGELSLGQWNQYRTQKRENAFVEDKSAYLRSKRARHKAIVRHSRNSHKERGDDDDKD